VLVDPEEIYESREVELSLSGQRDDGMDNQTDSGEASFLIPTSFTICNDMYSDGMGVLCYQNLITYF
jgi:hypothetical protein